MRPGWGHGRLIAAHASPPVRDRWLPRLLAGALAGIATTEAHGGSQVHATTTIPRRDGSWAVSGTKSWISRLDEAAVFCVFFKDPAGRLTAGVVDAGAAGLCRRPVTPSGLSGWAWGELHLDGVRLRRGDIVARPGKGVELLADAPGFAADSQLAKTAATLTACCTPTASMTASTGQSAALSPPGCSDPMREPRCHAWHRTGSRLHARPRRPDR